MSQVFALNAGSMLNDGYALRGRSLVLSIAYVNKSQRPGRGLASPKFFLGSGVATLRIPYLCGTNSLRTDL